MEQETSILSTINIEGKKLHTMKTLNRVVARKHNVEQVSQLFVTEKTIITLKIETFAKNNRSFKNRGRGFLKIDKEGHIINPDPLRDMLSWFDGLLARSDFRYPQNCMLKTGSCEQALRNYTHAFRSYCKQAAI